MIPLLPTFQLSVRFSAELDKAVSKARREVMKQQAQYVAVRAKAMFKKGPSSPPGGLPRRQSGNYRRSIRYRVVAGGAFAFVGPTQPKGSHAGMLKYGTKRMAPRAVPTEMALEIARPRLAAMYSGKL